MRENAARHNSRDRDDQQLPLGEPDYLDRTGYRAVHFHGPRLAEPLAKAADFLIQLEKRLNHEPYALTISAQYSWEDEASELAWRVTVVLGQPLVEGGIPAGCRA